MPDPKSKKIVGYHFLAYPDNWPEDPEYAASEIYVEVGGEDATPDNFDFTYSFQVYTLKYLIEQLREHGERFIVVRSVIIGDRFERGLIHAALESVLSEIETYGTKKE